VRLKEDRIDRKDVCHFCVVKNLLRLGASLIDRPAGGMAGLPPPWIRRWYRKSVSSIVIYDVTERSGMNPLRAYNSNVAIVGFVAKPVVDVSIGLGSNKRTVY